MSTRPLVSILMGAYNAEKHLEECLESLFQQTMTDWELIVCDDASTDATTRLLRQTQNKHPNRIRVLHNETNRGLAFSLNRGLEVAKGLYIARQDADDSAVAERLQTQVQFLEFHPEYDWVSSAMTVFGDKGAVGIRRPPQEPTEHDFFRGSPFAHAPTMFRGHVLRENRYRVLPYTKRTEDYDLWMRLHAKGHRGYNLPSPLYNVREDTGAYNRKRFRARIDEARTRFNGYRGMKAPAWAYFYALKPLIVGALPKTALMWLHEHRLKRH